MPLYEKLLFVNQLVQTISLEKIGVSTSYFLSHVIVVITLVDFTFFRGFSLHLSTDPPPMRSILLTIESIDFLHTRPNQLSRDLPSYYN